MSSNIRKSVHTESYFLTEFFKQSEMWFYISEFKLEAYFVQYLC